MSNLRRVDLNLITIFNAVITEGNMSRAAEKIGMSQPALSLAMSRFKHITGDQLFVRSGHGVRPTPRAIEMAASLRRALDLIDSALEAKEEFDARSSDRSFNLSLGDAGDLLVIPPLMQHLKHCHSNIQIHTLPFWSGNIKRGMLSGDVDLALWIEPFDQEGGEIISQQIGSESNMCVVRKDHPAVGDSLSLEQYAALKHMIIRLPGDYGSTVVDRELWGHDLQRKIAMSVHNLHSYPAILKSTDLVGTLPRSVAHSFASMYDLKVLPLPFTTDLPIYLSWPQTLDTDAGHQWLRNMVTAFYQENVTKIAEPTTDD